MDWTNLTFVIGTVVAAVIKGVWFKNNTATRDKVIPIFAFVANLFARLVENLSGTMTDVSSVSHGIALASFLDIEFIRLPLTAAMDTIMSLGVHRLKRWGDAVRMAEPKKKK